MSKIIGVTVGTPLSASSVANSLKGTAIGSAVAMKDISPLEHQIGVKLASKNLLDSANIQNGVELTSAWGNIGNNATWYVTGWIPVKPSTTYTISGTSSLFRAEVDADFNRVAEGNFDPAETFTTTEKTHYVQFNSLIEGYDKPQLEEGTTATAYAPFVADVSSVTLKKCGKNLVDISQMLNECLVDNGDGTFSYTRASSNYHSEAFPLKLKAGTPIALNMEQISTTDADDRLTCIFIYADGTSKSSYIGRGNAMTLTAAKDIVKVQIFSYNAGTVFVFKNFQIELGETATEYEPYKEPIPYTPKADGTVEVTSLYPTTTLLTDTEGVIISAEYNRDLNKAFAEIYQAIATMGAAAVTIPEEV